MPRLDSLTWWERLGLVGLGLLAIAFGVVVELRGALQQVRRTDFGVYARTAWAVRTGADIYTVSDDRGWHYCYPPPFAVLMVPFADPPKSESRSGYLPFAVSVGLWYLISFGLLSITLHVFASTILGPTQPTRRWWSARTWPFFVAIGGVGFTLARGQVNLLVLASFACLFAAWVRGRRFTAGLWLSVAIGIKVIPGILALFFLWKRDVRALAGVLTGLTIGLVGLPSMVWGVAGAIELNRRFVDVVLLPGSTGTGDQTRAKELTNSTATDSQSFQAVIHNWRHPDTATRPAGADLATRLVHWLIGGGLLLLLCRQSSSRPSDELVTLGGLSVIMLHLTPVSHMHYYAYGLPLVAGLWLRDLEADPNRVYAGRWTLLALASWGVMTAVPLFGGPVFEGFRNGGCGVLASVGLILFARWHRSVTTSAVIPNPSSDIEFIRHAA